MGGHVLWVDMFSGVHVFKDDMSYESICLKGGHGLCASREVLVCRRKYLVGGHENTS